MAERTAVNALLDLDVVRAAQAKVGIPSGLPLGAVLRGILATVAEVDLAEHLDHKPGRGSLTYRNRMARQAAGTHGRPAG